MEGCLLEDEKACCQGGPARYVNKAIMDHQSAGPSQQLDDTSHRSHSGKTRCCFKALNLWDVCYVAIDSATSGQPEP